MSLWNGPGCYQTMSLAVCQTMSPGAGCAEAVVAPISPNEMAATTPRTARRALRRKVVMAGLSWGCELGWCFFGGAAPAWGNRTTD